MPRPILPATPAILRAPASPTAPLRLAFAATAALLLACGSGETGTAGTPAPQGGKTDAPSPKKKSARPAPSPAQLADAAAKYFSPLPARPESPTNVITPEKVALGRQLYFDSRLSKGQDVSCNTCHLLDKFGVDNEPTSKGHKGQRGERNSPTVYNAAAHFAQFWDGRAATVEDQAQMPITNPVEMAMADAAYVTRTVKSIPGYVEAFNKVFPGEPDPISMVNIGKAIGAFERGLMTPGPFDEFLNGKMTALDGDALRGLELFIEFNCISCHTGPTVGGTMYQKLGSVKNYETKDEGRYKITKDEKDKYVFKVPGLRNVTKTAPYLHDGTATTLDDVLNIMATYQIPKGSLTDEERTYLKAFLTSLEGKLVDPTYIAVPELPPAGPDTPKPDLN